jgi:hypothetical protein
MVAAMSGTLSLAAGLLRGFATDFLTSHDVGEARRIMAPGYTLNIGGHVFAGRDEQYIPATAAQLDLFPGLVVTVHDVVLAPGWAAMRFTEHGVSAAAPGHAAAWGGITLFRFEGEQLGEGWAEEDYFARKRELKSGQCDPVLPPMAAPWDQPCKEPDPDTEGAVRQWLEQPDNLFGAGVDQIRVGAPGFADLMAPAHIAVSALFSAGSRAAFHATVSGTYRGGFGNVSADLAGQDIRLRVAGIADVAGGRVERVQLSADRLGLNRDLLGRRTGS